LALYSLPTRWPVNFNAGYVLRDPYNSKLGVETGEKTRVRPGDIFELRTSMQIPIPAHFAILTELAYYHVQREELNSVLVPDSAGQAMDALVGLSWDYNSWYLTGGVAFGLLDESHTSFDMERGAGDMMYRLRLGYKLFPHKPNE
jgi:hypothetical protein